MCTKFNQQNLNTAARLIEPDEGETDVLPPLISLCKFYSQRNLVDLVDYLTDDSASVEATAEDGSNALMVLFTNDNILQIEENIPEIVQLLIEKGVQANQTVDGISAFTYLTCHENLSSKTIIQVGELLIANGINVNYKEEFLNRNPLQLLCEISRNKEMDEIVKFLIEKGTEINHVDNSGRNPLMSLATFYPNVKNQQVIELLIANGIDIHHKDENGTSFLQYLFKNPHLRNSVLKGTQLLIEYGFDVNDTDASGDNGLIQLFKYRIDILSEKEFDYFYGDGVNDDVDDGSVFQIFEIADLLIASGIDINHEGHNGDNALTTLCRDSNSVKMAKLAELLIENEIDINHANDAGENAMMTLFRSPFPSDEILEMAKVLVEKGIDLNHKNNEGNNSIMQLIKSGYKDNLILKIAQLLIDEDVNIYQRNNEGKTLLDLLNEESLDGEEKSQIIALMQKAAANNLRYKLINSF